MALFNSVMIVYAASREGPLSFSRWVEKETKTVEQEALSQSGANKRSYTIVVWLDLAIF